MSPEKTYFNFTHKDGRVIPTYVVAAKWQLKESFTHINSTQFRMNMNFTIALTQTR